MKKPKHIRTEPIYGLISGKRVGTKYFYDEKEIEDYKKYKESKK